MLADTLTSFHAGSYAVVTGDRTAIAWATDADFASALRLLDALRVTAAAVTEALPECGMRDECVVIVDVLTAAAVGLARICDAIYPDHEEI